MKEVKFTYSISTEENMVIKVFIGKEIIGLGKARGRGLKTRNSFTNSSNLTPIISRSIRECG